MNIGGNSKQGIRVGEYSAGATPTINPDGNDISGWVEPAGENPQWILWFTKKGDALFYTQREPNGGVIGEPIRITNRRTVPSPDGPIPANPEPHCPKCCGSLPDDDPMLPSGAHICSLTELDTKGDGL